MERRRELASLKVLGYTAGEIRRTIFRENICLGLLAIPPGFLLGKIMCGALSKMFGGEMITLEVFIAPKTYLITAICGFIFIILAQWVNGKKIAGLDMVEVLKNREG
jgi:putative ABC transport system permease protein